MTAYPHNDRYLAVPPGLTIKDQIDANKMTKKEFAHRMGFTPEHVSRLLAGKVELTRDTAEKLELVLGPSASFWMGLENIYRDTIGLIEEEKQSEQLQKFPIKKMIKHNYFNDFNEKRPLKSLKAFFHVTDLALIDSDYYAVDNANLKNRKNVYKLCWVQKIFNDARSIWSKTFYKKDLKKINERIETYNRNPSTEGFSLLQENLLEYGVVLVYGQPLDKELYSPFVIREKGRVVVGVSDLNNVPYVTI